MTRALLALHHQHQFMQLICCLMTCCEEMISPARGQMAAYDVRW